MHGANRFRKSATLLSALLLALANVGFPASGQTAAASTLSPMQQTADENGQPEVPFILRTTTREVVTEVVALNQRSHPVSDMKESEFDVFVVRGWPLKSRRTIAAFQAVDPALPKPHLDSPSSGFRTARGESCVFGRYSHYEIAFQPLPGDSTAGYHEILVTTSRPNVRLLYRRKYYVGETRTLSRTLRKDNAVVAVLQQAACYHPAAPPSISLAAQPIQTEESDALRFSFVVQPDSLAFISLSNETRRVLLDLGICTFDAEGIPLDFMHTSIGRDLTPLEYQRSLVLGFRKQVEFPKQGNPALIRLVVRDRTTGNLGTLAVIVPNAAREQAAKEEAAAIRKLREAQAGEDRKRPAMHYLNATNGPIRSFGTILPQSGAMCGDVYDVPALTRALPDFWDLDPIGTVYADELNVPQQNIVSSSAIPGVTKAAEWFGIDYYGEFWIDTPGDYTFQLFSDDGAKLFIDDNVLIDLNGLHDVLNREAQIHLEAGRHTLHLPYYQGPGGLALMLLVKPPDGDYEVFDVRDFAPPGGGNTTLP